MLVKKEFILKLIDYVQGLIDKARGTDQDTDRLLVEEARREWKLAREYFNTVTDPDLIDHAIFALEAAEKRYIYLLKRIREEETFKANLNA